MDRLQKNKINNMEFNNSTPVGAFVAHDYRTAATFKKYKIDFCCKGGKSISEVCQSKNLQEVELLDELQSVMSAVKTDDVDFTAWPLNQLADYIEKKHHKYVEETNPVLRQFLDKLCKVHGANHPELFEINAHFTACAGELTTHMKKEELILFPHIRKMVRLNEAGSPLETPTFGTVTNPIQMMMQEHETEGDRFELIAKLTDNYTTPADGCTTYKVTFQMLQEFENDLHRHIHLENNILFPAAVELEQKMNSVSI